MARGDSPAPPPVQGCEPPLHTPVLTLCVYTLAADIAVALCASFAPSLCLLQVSRGDVEILVDTFPGQSIDFFGALRARVYDDKVSSWPRGSTLLCSWLCNATVC